VKGFSKIGQYLDLAKLWAREECRVFFTHGVKYTIELERIQMALSLVRTVRVLDIVSFQPLLVA